MLNTKQHDLDFNSTVELFKKNDEHLLLLVEKIKKVYANTLLKKNKEAIDSLRYYLLIEDVRSQEVKLELIKKVIESL